MYRPLNQYHVVMEVAPQFQQTPEALQNIYLASSNGAPIPLAAFTHFEPSNTPLAVNHQGQFPSVTISFNLAPGVSLGQATQAIENAERTIGFPPTIQPVSKARPQLSRIRFPANRSLIIDRPDHGLHRARACSTKATSIPSPFFRRLPSAGVGALLALLLTHNELNVIGTIGIILLIGLVKKNAIMMIDFALDVERNQGKKPARGDL